LKNDLRLNQAADQDHPGIFEFIVERKKHAENEDDIKPPPL